MKYLNLGLAVCFNVAAYTVFRSVSHHERNAAWAAVFACGLALAAVNTGFFTAAMRQIPLSTAYPIFAGASIALVTVVSVAVFKETLTVTGMAGAVLVIAGIALLSR